MCDYPRPSIVLIVITISPPLFSHYPSFFLPFPPPFSSSIPFINSSSSPLIHITAIPSAIPSATASAPSAAVESVPSPAVLLHPLLPLLYLLLLLLHLFYSQETMLTIVESEDGPPNATLSQKTAPGEETAPQVSSWTRKLKTALPK